MSNTVLSPNMDLPVPVVGQDPGPQYATDINSCLGIIDSHNHTPGSGVQITPDGLNINVDLPINSHNLTLIRTTRFSPQGSPISPIAPDLNVLFVAGVDLYFNDGNGNNIQITQGGGIAGSPGSISGLVSPASASYVVADATFVWQSDVNTSASMDMGSIIIRENVVNANGITIESPTSLSADYSMILPTGLPGSNLPLSLNSGGQISAAKVVSAQIGNGEVKTINILDANVTRAKLDPLGQDTTIGSGTPAVTNTTPTTIAGPVTITTDGLRPVFVSLINTYSAANPCYIEANTADVRISILRNGVEVCLISLGGSGTIHYAPSSISFIDLGLAAGTYIYEMQVFNASTGSNVVWVNVGMIAYEMR